MVEALILIGVLVALMAVFAADQHASLQATQNRLRQRRAEAAAHSALVRGMAIIQDANINLVTLNDDWALLGNNGQEAFDLGNGVTFRLEILDAGSFSNINTMTQVQLEQLPLTQEQIDCLLDWRETSLTARPDGAKDDYYNNLQTPYNTRLGLLTTVDELLLIENWTAADLYSPITNVQPLSGTATDPQDAQGNPLPLIDLLTVDSGSPNTQASGSPRINFAIANLTAAQLARLGLPATLAGQRYATFQALFAGVGQSATVEQAVLNAATFTTGSRNLGMININTAPASVLMELPNMTQAVADAIVAQQTTGFTGLGDLTTIPGLTSGALLPQIAGNLCVGSDTWIVRAYGESGGMGTAIEAVVGMRAGRAEVETWQKVSNSGIPAWWSWSKDTTQTVDAGAVQ